MKVASSLALLLLLLVSLVCIPTHTSAQGYEYEDESDEESAEYTDDSPVAVLTAATFDDAVNNLASYVLVEFYAPWCGHCKRLKPVYEEAAARVKELGMDAALAALDATTARELTTSFGVKGFPTIKLFKKGKVVDDFQGGRDADSIVEYLETRLAPVVTTFETAEELDKLSANKRVVVIGNFAKENKAAQDAYHESCKTLRDTPAFSHVRCLELASSASSAVTNELDLVMTPTVRVRRNFPGVSDDAEARDVDFDFFTEEGFNTDKITTFIRNHCFPALAEITPENYGFYEKRGLPIGWLFVDGHGKNPPYGMGDAKENTPAQAAAQKEQLAMGREVAKAYAGKVSFVYLSGIDYSDHATHLGIDVDNLPGLSITVTEQAEADPNDVDGQGTPPREHKYVCNATGSEASTESLSAWVGDFVAGKVEPHVKSEPVPAKNDGPVKVVVAKTFDELVYDNDDDVFIEFYAPWCGHCKQLAPIWEELGRDLAGTPGITIAKMDATANDAPPQIQGFPTIYFHKGSDKSRSFNPQGVYEGGRSKQDFIRFLQENSDADLASVSVPVDTDKILKFLDGFEAFSSEVRRLVDENKQLNEMVESLTGGDVQGEDEDFDDVNFEDDEYSQFDDDDIPIEDFPQGGGHDDL